MKWNEVGTQVCSVARALSVIGDRWTLLVLREAFSGVTRFEGFIEGVGASRATVAERLGRLTREGVLAVADYQTNPVRREYLLTEKGSSLLPVLLSLQDWGDQWLDDGSGPPARLLHRRCGKPTRPLVVCSGCGEELGVDVTVEYREDAWAKRRGTAQVG